MRAETLAGAAMPHPVLFTVLRVTDLIDHEGHEAHEGSQSETFSRQDTAFPRSAWERMTEPCGTAPLRVAEINYPKLPGC